MKVRVGDIDIFYRFDGPEDGPPVIMAHALGTAHELWDWQMPALTGRYRVLRYDWRGHGQTSAPEGSYVLDQFVADAVGLMDALALESAHWVGISTGGMIGQGLALDHPARIRSLALCNTMARAPEAYRTWTAERRQVADVGGLEALWEATKRVWFSDAFVESDSPEAAAVREIYLRNTVSGYFGATAAVSRLDYLDRLPEIAVPTLILAAGDDGVTSPALAQAMHERIPGSRLEVLEGLRHFSNVEDPTHFNAVLLDHLDQAI